MLSVKLNGPMLEMKFETFVGTNEFKYTNELLRSLPGAIYSDESRKFYIPKEHIDFVDEHFGDKMAWFNSIEDIKGIREAVVPQFHVTSEGLEDLKLQPYPFQTVGISFLHDIECGIIADEMGLGKSVQLIGAIHRLHKEKKVRKALIVCPSSLKYQWKDEIQKFTDYEGIVIDGTPKQRAEQFATWQEGNQYLFAIVNYELVRNDIDAVIKMDFQAIAADEIHRVKNPQSKTSKAFKLLDAPYKFGATGTPMQNAPEELWNVMDWVNPTVLGNFWGFNKRHIVRADKFNNHNVIIGYKALGELRKQVSPFMLRRMKVDVAKDLPPMIYHTYHVEMTPEQRKLQDLIQEDMMEALKKLNEEQSIRMDEEQEGEEGGAIMGYFNLLCSVANATDLLHLSDAPMVRRYAKEVKQGAKSPKIDEIVTICKDLLEQGTSKIVLFTRFERMQRLLTEELSKLGGVQLLNGKMKPFERQASVDKFKYDYDANFFITTDAGNFGINLQFANKLINVDLPWNPATYDQRNGRVHRIGSTFDRVDIIDVITKGSIDERIREVLYAKKELANQIVEKNEEERAMMNKMTANVMKQLLPGKKKRGK